MKTSVCSCGNRLFFDSTRCVACDCATGFCPICRVVRDLRGDAISGLHCGSCSASLQRCRNFTNDVCNVFVPAHASLGDDPLCEYCALTRVIPDLSVDVHHDRWRRLERAKRRVLIGIESFGVSPRKFAPELPLWFEFKADREQPVTTGHANGVITINIREADDVEREKSRVELREPQRTLVGHFRHELGHYFWQVLMTGELLTQFRAVFGSEEDPPYAIALQKYYESTEPADWQDRFISQYASMHPWEDFAETFNAYLDMRAALETATHFGLCPPLAATFPEVLLEYQRLGIVANELSRDFGLLDLVPEVFVPVVAKKLEFVHRILMMHVDPSRASVNEPEWR